MLFDLQHEDQLHSHILINATNFVKLSAIKKNKIPWPPFTLTIRVKYIQVIDGHKM
jgi:hypothetical protein